MPVFLLHFGRFLANATLAIFIFLVTTAACAGGFTFAAIGDMPYGTDVQFMRLIDRLNGEALAFTVHVGDIKSGNTPCSDETFLTVREMFGRFDQPLIYTPGDNEWTDCHRKSNGAMDPLERLATIRSLFFPSAMSLGKAAIKLEVQSNEEAFRHYVENRIWAHEHVTFATLHVVGSNNNWRRDMKADDEFYARDAANRHWLARAFALAKERNDIAVVLAMQADTMFAKNTSEESGFTSWMAAFEQEAAAWGKPVLLIQGDTHEFRLDQPFGEAGMHRLPKVMRLVVPGAGNVAAVLVTVNAERREAPFSFGVLKPENGRR